MPYLPSIGQFGNTWLYNYKYDQLNRIREMDVYKTGYNAATNRWGGGTTGEDPLDASEDYKERVNYDANGNILAYLRNKDYGAAGRDMDNLKYWYQYKTSSGSVGHFDPAATLPSNIAELTNKLGYVDDAVAADKSTVDIDDQASGNYSYDEIGNLVADAQEGITSIKWSVYGKILEINRAQRSPLADSIKKITYTYDAAGNRIGKIVERYATSRIDYTWYVRDAQGNAMGVYNYSSASGLSAGTLRLNETPLYGSSRLGILNRDIDVEQPLGVINIANFERGSKFFELSNHLGNVLVTVSDRKVPANVSAVGAAVTYYKPVGITANDYYPFGMGMPGRDFNNAGFKDYRYGFNGKENDNDVKGVEGSQQDYGMRIYDPRLGRFLSVDPLGKKYPWYTPYQFTGNSPIVNIDIDGLEPGSTQPNTQPSNPCPDCLKAPGGGAFQLPPATLSSSTSAKTVAKAEEKKSGSGLLHGIGRFLKGVGNTLVDVGDYAIGFLRFNKNNSAIKTFKAAWWMGETVVAFADAGGDALGWWNASEKSTHRINEVGEAIRSIDWNDPYTYGYAAGMFSFPCALAKLQLLRAGKIVTQLTAAEVLEFFGQGDRIFNHFTNLDGVIGITGLSEESALALKAGESMKISSLSFGEGTNSFMANTPGAIFVTDLPLGTSSGKLSQIGVFKSTGKQQFTLSFSAEQAWCQGVKVFGANPERNIYTIPSNTQLTGEFILTRNY